MRLHHRELVSRARSQEKNENLSSFSNAQISWANNTTSFMSSSLGMGNTPAISIKV